MQNIKIKMLNFNINKWNGISEHDFSHFFAVCLNITHLHGKRWSGLHEAMLTIQMNTDDKQT